ncbi:P-II family nitrogen regulator [Hyphococcus flavus]|uniref:Nitrogen regulatory protein P-II n=1 Tax=Hyphococcus flavus TaxID=1866326 RepID=A0AAE9ZB90_9PROT|nr:P-II family nitrogen regulator [Hyphococcus flavus]WDI30841.1 P-II family nitrogen regulator [Hyphococcus flavus]
MKYIIAVVKPHRLEDIRTALTAMGVEGLTVSDVKGFGRQKGHSEVYRGAEYQVDFVPKVKLEIAIAASEVTKVIEAICGAAKTDRIGDGKIFVLDLEDAVRVRTGETGAAAI